MKMIRVERKRTRHQRQISIQILLTAVVSAADIHDHVLTVVVTIVNLYLISCFFTLFPYLVPLCNFSMPLLTTFLKWASFTPSLSSSPMSRAYTPFPVVLSNVQGLYSYICLLLRLS
uniref:Uncharacterized protein n=1 Tax=Populus davidiana TaxID=266767 RepID=A0A6M2EHC7_9ROSI